jgi:23S rRNA (uracil1939-C5)-methyltransferase
MRSGDQVPLSITALSKRGLGVGMVEKSRVEVIGAVPGDELAVKLYTKKRSVWRADLIAVDKPSEERVACRCLHAPACGGCTWQQVLYGAQLREKQRRVEELFSFSSTPVEPILACQEPWGYRNKMEFSFSQNRAGERFLGLILAGTRGHVFNLTECHLTSPWMPALLAEVRAWWQASDLLAYRLDNTGSLRTLTVREGKRRGDKLVFLTVSGNPDYALKPPHIHSFIEAVKRALPEGSSLSLFLRIQQIHKGSPTQFFEMHLFGKDHILEKLTLPLDPVQELLFKISPTSFFQPNTAQAQQLYATALQMVSWPKKQVFDLYAGTATLGMAAASLAERVTAIEINPHACFDAEVNKELNGLANLEILCGDVGQKLKEIPGRPDLVLIDPPRAGLDAVALAHLKALQSPELLYISCNPETQAANIKELIASGYTLARIKPVDQFPHTPHIENCALLRR